MQMTHHKELLIKEKRRINKASDNTCISQGSYSKSNLHMHVYTYRFISRNWLIQLWWLTGVKDEGQALGPDPQAGADAAV